MLRDLLLNVGADPRVCPVFCFCHIRVCFGNRVNLVIAQIWANTRVCPYDFVVIFDNFNDGVKMVWHYGLCV